MFPEPEGLSGGLNYRTTITISPQSIDPATQTRRITRRNKVLIIILSYFCIFELILYVFELILYVKYQVQEDLMWVAVVDCCNISEFRASRAIYGSLL